MPFFSIYDELGVRVGAEICGTLSSIRFKSMERGSRYGYGFNVRFSNDSTFDYILFFESALDLISFVDIARNFYGKSLARCILVSLSGLRHDIFFNSLSVFTGLPVLCIDNDAAADAFIRGLQEKSVAFMLRRPLISFKDWNEQLKHFRCSS